MCNTDNSNDTTRCSCGFDFKHNASTDETHLSKLIKKGKRIIFRKEDKPYRPSSPEGIKVDTWLNEQMNEAKQLAKQLRKEEQKEGRKETLLVVLVTFGWLGLCAPLSYYVAGALPTAEHRSLWKFFLFLMSTGWFLTVLMVSHYTNKKKNLKLTHKAAEQGNIAMQTNLGEMYYYGEGVTQDYKEAFKWFHKAAEQGNEDAQVKLGVIYYKGHGVTMDYVWSYMWFNRAVSGGYEDAIGALDSLEKIMTPEQIAEAQRLSRDFKARGNK